MCVRAIDLNQLTERDDLRLRILAEIVGNDRAVKRVSFPEIAKKLGIDRQSVAYHVRRLVEQGYLRAYSSGYEPTEKVIFFDGKTTS